MRDFLEFAGATLALFAAAAVLLGGVVLGVSYGLERPSCYARWAGSSYEARWSLFGDCQIKINGTWLPDSKYKNVELQK